LRINEDSNYTKTQEKPTTHRSVASEEVRLLLPLKKSNKKAIYLIFRFLGRANPIFHFAGKRRRRAPVFEA